MKHFGVTIKPGKYGYKLTRENYALVTNNLNSFYEKCFPRECYQDEACTRYTEEWCKSQYEKCMINFDLNMEYFQQLDATLFCDEINRFLKKHTKFKEVVDINQYESQSGYYMMVLDEYKQVYIGTSIQLKQRIQQHWIHRTYLDRLLCPMNAVESSLLSMDSFRAKDTTRIYIFKTQQTYEKEDKYLRFFSPEYVCNRISGGALTSTLMQQIDFIKKRKFIENKEDC